MTSRTSRNACSYKAAALVTFVAFISLAFVLPRRDATAAASRRMSEPQRRAGNVRRGSQGNSRTRRPPRPSSIFSHRVAEHQRQACDSCHKFPSPNWKEARQGDEAFPDITQHPKHASCLDCHRRQFFARERPSPRICSVCHAAATPRDQTRHPFPNPPAAFDASARGHAHVSDFRINFPHDKHLELFSQSRPPGGDAARIGFVRASFGRDEVFAGQESDPKSCATCHQTYQPQNDSDDEFVTAPPKDLAEGAFWLKKGTFKTVPRDHASCFTCHSVDGGIEPMPSNCAACHKLPPPGTDASLTRAHDDFNPTVAAAMGVRDKTMLESWSQRDAARFRHEWPPHDLACTSCHDAAAMNTLDEATKKVPVMSCGGGGTGCHVEPTDDGILNVVVARKKAEPTFVCTKCHVFNGRLPVPETHLRAVSPPQTK